MEKTLVAEVRKIIIQLRAGEKYKYKGTKAGFEKIKKMLASSYGDVICMYPDFIPEVRRVKIEMELPEPVLSELIEISITTKVKLAELIINKLSKHD